MVSDVENLDELDKVFDENYERSTENDSNAKNLDELDKVFDENYDPKEESTAQRREKTRTILAKGLLGIFAISVVGSFVWVFAYPFLRPSQICFPNQAHLQDTSLSNNSQRTLLASYRLIQAQAPSQTCTIDTTAKDTINLLLNSVSTILGTALGFYFGSQTVEQNQNN